MKTTAKQMTKQHADNGAAAIGVLVQISVMFDLPNRLGITAEQAFELGGLLLILGGLGRGWWRAREAAKNDQGAALAPE